ncbi:MAG TPA: hypothetical protein VMF08_07395 [Candidatus Sulfotelmatobacter sp.]|nr:hypothetical protein [Candidatus Sulfotelmatobacter sp.]
MEIENSSAAGPPCEPKNPEPVARRRAKKSGPKSKVTVALVKRVSKRVARGIPIRLALSGEPVTRSAYKKQLQRHPDLAAIQETAKLQFLDKAFDVILANPGPMLCWLLERTHPDIFAKPREEAPVTATATEAQTQTQTQTIAGVPQYLVEQARKNAERYD